jgi:hypothetical protein
MDSLVEHRGNSYVASVGAQHKLSIKVGDLQQRSFTQGFLKIFKSSLLLGGPIKFRPFYLSACRGSAI